MTNEEAENLPLERKLSLIATAWRCAGIEGGREMWEYAGCPDGPIDEFGFTWDHFKRTLN